MSEATDDIDKSAQEANREKKRLYYKRRPGRIHEDNLKRLYGITPREYDELLAAQGGRCANGNCKSPPSGKYGKLHLDHNHETGAIRGFLCHNCNTALGHAKEDPHRLLGLVEYIKKHNQPDSQSPLNAVRTAIDKRTSFRRRNAGSGHKPMTTAQMETISADR